MAKATPKPVALPKDPKPTKAPLRPPLPAPKVGKLRPR